MTKIELGKTNPFDGCKNLKRFTNNSCVDYVLNRSIHGYDDINSDGEINIQDGVLLKKHLAGMNVTIGKE